MIRYVCLLLHYPSDVSDAEWSFVASYLTLMKEDSPQRSHNLRAVFNGLRFIVRSGSPWRYVPHDLPPWHTVFQQAKRWEQAGIFDKMAHDLREILCLLSGRSPQPTAAIMDSRTLQSMPESGSRAGYDGVKKKKGSKVHHTL